MDILLDLRFECLQRKSNETKRLKIKIRDMVTANIYNISLHAIGWVKKDL